MACIMPIRVKAKRKLNDSYTGQDYIREDGYQLVPCGKCSKCRLRRANDWALRLSVEDKHYNGGIFVTLTYSPDYILRAPFSEVYTTKKTPYGLPIKCIDYVHRLTPKGYLTVNKRDIQTFMKRLRFNTGKKIKYYAAAEYGGEGMRPHYHLIMFGCTIEDVEAAWCDDQGPIGHYHVGDVNGATVAYTLKYISKPKQVPQHANDDRTPEFSLMSKNLGLAYLTPQKIRWHKGNMASYTVKEGGYKAALPRYYRDRIFDDWEKSVLEELVDHEHKKQHEKLIQEAGSLLEYYRLQGEIARDDQRKMYEKNTKSNLSNH